VKTGKAGRGGVKRVERSWGVGKGREGVAGGRRDGEGEKW